MFPALYLPLGYILLVVLLLLMDEYRIRNIHNNRLEARAEIIWPITIETISGPIYGQTKNISASGAFLVCRQPLYKGDVVRCIVKAPSRSLEMDAEVIWSDIYQPPDKDFPHNGIGILFKRIPSESRDFLALSVYDSLNSAKK